MKQKGICEECKKEYEYEYKKDYPRKYCHKCSAEKRKEFDKRGSAESQENYMQYEDGDGLELTPIKPEVQTITGGMKAKTNGDNTDWEIGNRKVRIAALASAIECVSKPEL